MRWTEQQYADHLARRGVPGASAAVDVSEPPFALPNDKRQFALGRLPIGTMNKTEAAYDKHLWEQRSAGEVLWHKFEAVKLRLADNTFYTCDFCVLSKDGVLEMHEVKGWMMEDANVKIKVAASLYPFRFKLVRARAKRDGGGWSVSEY